MFIKVLVKCFNIYGHQLNSTSEVKIILGKALKKPYKTIDIDI